LQTLICGLASGACKCAKMCGGKKSFLQAGKKTKFFYGIVIVCRYDIVNGVKFFLVKRICQKGTCLSSVMICLTVKKSPIIY